jgi:hypothetical protein
MHMRLASGLNLVLIAGLASACGEPEVSNLTYAEIRDAAQGKDAAAYRSYFRDIKGKRVAWSGRVVEIKTEHGDEFVEVSALVVDLDGATPEEDAVSRCPPQPPRTWRPGAKSNSPGRSRTSNGRTGVRCCVSTSGTSSSGGRRRGTVEADLLPARLN